MFRSSITRVALATGSRLASRQAAQQLVSSYISIHKPIEWGSRCRSLASTFESTTKHFLTEPHSTHPLRASRR